MMQNLQNWLITIDPQQGQPFFLGNSLILWLLALAVAVLLFVILRLGKIIVVRYLSHIAEPATREGWRLAVEPAKKTMTFFLAALALYGGFLSLNTSERAETAAGTIIILLFLFQAAVWVDTLIAGNLEYLVRRKSEKDASSVAMITVTGFIARLAAWSLILLLALDNLGFNITALIAGLGIGGVAVALAAQNILSDLFASVSIVLDRPFEVGDFISVGEFLGTVEYIGVKTTRLRSLSGEQLVFSNNDLLSSRIRNYKRMYERRALFQIGVVYQTPHETIAAIPGILREIIESQENARFDRAHFAKYGDFALVFETVYYVKSPDYNLYMDIQQAINLDIHRRFQARGIEFAYPTQTLFLETTDP